MSASRWSTDALWPGDAIVARLKAQVPALREVVAVDELDAAETQTKQMPGAVVLCRDLRPVSSTPLRKVVQVQQDWLVVLVVAPAAREPDASATVLGPLIAAVVAALQGWQPDDTRATGAGQALTWLPGPAPQYGPVTLFPVLFRLVAVTA